MNKAQEKVLARAIDRCRERGVILPTFKQLADPSSVPAAIKSALKTVGLNELHPLNLFRITWNNEPVESGGGFGGVNYLRLPPELTGVPAPIFVLLGRHFPTGAHKVGATYGTLVEKLVSGQFDPSAQKAVWPSTGNYCRGGAYNSALLGCPAVAVLPEEMSPERFEWLAELGAEVIRTPGGESNVKEIYDRVNQLAADQGDRVVVLNQFAEFGNARWHYAVTGPALAEVFRAAGEPGLRLSALFLTQGSAGTLAAGDYLREYFPTIKIAAGEAAQCPTLMLNGFGYHRIEGIGDKHVPWIHNLRNMDMVVAVDDELVLRLMRLFNEEAGTEYLLSRGVDPATVEALPDLGLSSIANIIGAIKLARYYEYTAHDAIFTVATDSMALYRSRLAEARDKWGPYTATEAAVDFEGRLAGLGRDNMLELSYYDRLRMHNLKYFTWVEQQGRSAEELQAQWYDEEYWSSRYAQVAAWDQRINEFNQRTGLLEQYQ